MTGMDMVTLMQLVTATDKETLTHILVQLPIVGLFLWYVIKSTEDWRKYLEKRDESFFQMLRDVRDDLNNSLKDFKSSIDRLSDKL